MWKQKSYFISCNSKIKSNSEQAPTPMEDQTSEWLIIETKSKKMHKLILTKLNWSDLSKECVRLVTSVVYSLDKMDKDFPHERDEDDTDMFSSCAQKILKSDEKWGICKLFWICKNWCLQQTTCSPHRITIILDFSD